MPVPSAIVELTPITTRGRDLLDEFESKTGQPPFKVIEKSGVRAYYVEDENVGQFKSTLDRVEPHWERHLAFRDVRPTEE